MVAEFLLIFGVSIIVYTFYKLATENSRYFAQRNLKCVSVSDVILGTFSLFFGGMDLLEVTQNAYNRFPNES